MNDAEIAALVDQKVAEAIGAKDQEIAQAIATGLRTFADRPVGEKGAPSLQFGIVEQVADTYAFVTLDGQTNAVPINMLGGLVEGQRVAVMLFPPSGNLAIGMVAPSTVGGLPPNGAATFVLTKASDADFDVDWEAADAGLPISFDDGTVTYTIDIESGNLVLKTVKDSGSVLASKLRIIGGGSFAEGGFAFDDPGGGGIFFNQHTAVGTGGVFFNLFDQGGFFVNDGTGGGTTGGGAGIIFNTTSSGEFTVNAGGGGIFLNGEGSDIQLDPDTGSGVYVFNLPTSDPGNSGQLWNSSGTLKVSP